ncbi:MAG: hypothetical protein NVSMB19_19410 [Vulcanimicrobiaceae bacterium]
MALGDRNPLSGTGESSTKHGKDEAKDKAEEGHRDKGRTGADRPAGGSSSRLGSSVDPQDPVDPQSPHLPPA